MSAGKASYQMVGKTRRELLNEFLAAVGKECENHQVKFRAISLDDPSLQPEEVEFAVTVKFVDPARQPIIVDLEDATDASISFQIHLYRDREVVDFEIIN